MMNSWLIEVEGGDSSGNSRCFLHRKWSGRCMSWRPQASLLVEEA